MDKVKTLLASLFAILYIATMPSCEPEDPISIPATKITINKPILVLEAGDSCQLAVTVEPISSTDIITWTSSDENVATISSEGMVKAINKGTSDIIAVTSGGLSDTCALTVELNIPSIQIALDKDTLELKVDSTYQLSATITPETSTDIITWRSSDETIATVSDNGTITAIAAGNATITATATSGTSASCELTVTTIQALYILGTINGNAYVWKNMEILYNFEGQSFQPIDMDIYNSNVYITANVNGTNGVYLNGQKMEGYVGSSIQVVNGNIYTLHNGTIYKNGTQLCSPKPIDLECTSMKMYVAEPYVYICVNPKGYGPRLWKINSTSGNVEETTYICKDINVTQTHEVNGHPESYEEPIDSLNVLAGDILVDGTDVYIVGRRTFKSYVQYSNLGGFVWKNGKEIKFAQYACFLDIIMFKNNIYMASSNLSKWPQAAVYTWQAPFEQNSLKQKTLSTQGNARSVCVCGDDIYVVGHDGNSIFSGDVIWINGKATKLGEKTDTEIINRILYK